MSTTPAANLARLRCTYPTWKIERRGDLWRAVNGTRVIAWTTAGDLEQQLAKQTWKGTTS